MSTKSDNPSSSKPCKLSASPAAKSLLDTLMSNLNADLKEFNICCPQRDFIDHLIRHFGEANAYALYAELSGHSVVRKVVIASVDGSGTETFEPEIRKPGLPPKSPAKTGLGTTNAPKPEEPLVAEGTDKHKIKKSQAKKPESKGPDQPEPEESEARKDERIGQTGLFTNAE